jgi:thiamine kinase-like enzyme
MPDRQAHQPEVHAFLQQHLGSRDWEFSIPHSWGNENYFARSGEQACFVKLDVQAPRYVLLASLGLTPPVLAAGFLADGASIIVQPHIDGRSPNRRDYRLHLEQFAAIIDQVHHNAALQQLLPPAASDRYSVVGLETLSAIRRRWEKYRPQAPEVAGFVDQSLASLSSRIESFQGAGLVASHNDICNANWLITDAGQLYLIDLESMSLDDPALDIGATLWWYYRPEQWQAFLEAAGYAADESFRQRMQVRMALHCLNITLPREHSFDQFDAASFPDDLRDFRAMLSGEPNPEINED